MVITERLVSPKRHTLGYVISGKKYTRTQAVKLAQKGKLHGVKVVRNQNKPYLMGVYMPLYELPTRLMPRSF
mgnify:CR=1 FL=1